MKTCPVCGARCFDDMAVCYGCLHDFSRAALAERGEASDAFSLADRAAKPSDDACDADGLREGRGEAEPSSLSDEASSPCLSCACGEGGKTSFMPVPMVTVVSRRETPSNASCEAVAVFEIRVPRGSSVVLCAQ